MTQENIYCWPGLLAFGAIMLAIDLGVLNRKARTVSFNRERWHPHVQPEAGLSQPVCCERQLLQN